MLPHGQRRSYAAPCSLVGSTAHGDQVLRACPAALAASRDADVFYSLVYGLVLESNAPIPELLANGRCAGSDLRLTFSASGFPGARDGYALRLVSEERLACGEPFACLYEDTTTYVLRYTRVADYCLHKSARQINVYPTETAAPEEVRLFLLGGVLSLALELRGIPSLHASAVVIQDKAVAFLGNAGGGKSTLAASFLEAGDPLLTDDILPLSWHDGQTWATFGYPQMRLWPDEAQHFLGHYEDLERVLPTLSKRRVPVGPGGWGTFCDAAQPLACVYLPQRRSDTEGTEIAITPVSPRDALIELVRHSFAASIVEQLGLQRQRLDLFAQMVQQVPMRRLVYPSGFEHLPRVRQAILEDLASLA